MKVLVTGGTGFLGGNVVGALLAAGHEPRVLVRGALPPGHALASLEHVRGDVTDAAALTRAASGCAAIMHMAALVKVWVPERERFEQTNVGGLRHALAAARQVGARLVYTSSFIALGPAGPEPADETRQHPHDHYRNEYERTKALADAEACAAARAGDDIVMLYPGVVYGPGELTEGNLVVKLALDHLRGRVPGIVGPGDRLWSYSYVKDVAAGHVAALERGRSGERYLLCGDNVDMRGFFAALERVTGVAPPRRHIPYGVASALGRAAYLWAELTGHAPQLTHEVVGVFREHWAYSSTKAIQELGYRVTPLEAGLRQTLASLGEVTRD
jgi:farnesol dehydrogenase